MMATAGKNIEQLEQHFLLIMTTTLTLDPLSGRIVLAHKGCSAGRGSGGEKASHLSSITQANHVQNVIIDLHCRSLCRVCRELSLKDEWRTPQCGSFERPGFKDSNPWTHSGFVRISLISYHESGWRTQPKSPPSTIVHDHLHHIWVPPESRLNKPRSSPAGLRKWPV